MGRYGTRKLLGTRDVVGEEDEIQPNGQIFRYISAVKENKLYFSHSRGRTGVIFSHVDRIEVY